MTAFPKPCGRLDHHEPHEWVGHWPAEATTTNPQRRDYHCTGRVVREGGYFADWDAADDAYEHYLDRQIRDGLADGWGVA